MNQRWEVFLNSRGIQPDLDPSAGTPSQISAADTILSDLSHLGLIRIGGPEAASFLQSQFTTDVTEVSPQRAQLSCYCNPKGRMLATFLLFQHEDDYYAQLPLDLLATLLQRLRLYVLRAKVKLTDASDELVRVGLAGDRAEATLATVLEDVPREAYDAVTSGSLTAIRLPGPTPRYELVAGVEVMHRTWDALIPSASIGNARYWSWLDIRAGLPTVYPDTSEAFVPQMANMELIGGVSFTKGCYPGQEVVARMHYLGKPKRRMYLAHIESGEPPGAATELFSHNDPSGQSAGKVVEAGAAADGGVDLLAVVQTSAHDRGDIRLGHRHGEVLAFLPLPYSLDPDAVSDDQS